MEAANLRSDAPNNQKRSRVFVSYKRNVEPDERIALQMFEALRQEHDVFIDQTMLVGMRWAEHIENELRRTDFFIVCISVYSVGSEMVFGEIEKAHQLSKIQNGHPAILPVSIAYNDSLPYPLNAYLSQLNWAIWTEEKDTPRLIEQLKQAISGDVSRNPYIPLLQESRTDSLALIPPPSASAQPLSIEMPEGTMNPESQFYVERGADQIAQNAIARQGVTITIKGPRQMGKSSLLMRIINSAKRNGKSAVFLDFQLFDDAVLANADSFFYQFCVWLTDELGVEDKIEEYWNPRLGNAHRCTRYVQRYLLEGLDCPVVLAMDEVESIFDRPFRTDFFSMLRSWHNSRATPGKWKQLDLVLVTSTEPYQFIDDLNLSPFNVGETIELQDFSPDQVMDLNRRHKFPLTASDEARLTTLLHGHPYLTRRALYLVATNRITASDLFSSATHERGPFGDHLRYHLFRLHGNDTLVAGLKQVLRHNTCSDDHIFFRLRGAGLIRKEDQAVVARCPLYTTFFKEHLNV